MATAARIISRALRTIGVQDATEAPEAEDFQSAAESLNSLGRRLAANGLFQQWTDVANPADTLATPPTADDALVYGLAVRLRAEYGTAPAEDIIALAQQATAALWRDRLVAAGHDDTIGGIIYRALRILSGGGVSGFPDDFSLSAALYALDALASRWLRSGLIDEWDRPDDLTATFPLGPRAHDAFANNLAVRLASEYGVPLRDETIALAQDGAHALWRDRLEATGSDTVGAVVRRALRMLSVSGPMPDRVGFDAAIEALNAMMRRWEANGMAMGWNDVSVLTEALPAPPEAEEAIAYNLAIAISAEFGTDLRPDIIAKAQEGLDALRRDRLVANPLELSRPARRYNIRTDEYDC